jgi:hypothetical protein
VDVLFFFEVVVSSFNVAARLSRRRKKTGHHWPVFHAAV